MSQLVKSLPAMWETQVQSLGGEDPLEKEMATHSSILVWEIPWTEEPGGLQSIRSQRVRHKWVTNTFTFLYTFLDFLVLIVKYKCSIFFFQKFLTIPDTLHYHDSFKSNFWTYKNTYTHTQSFYVECMESIYSYGTTLYVYNTVYLYYK